MGWERKRGKLAEFNRFLRGGDPGAFSRIVGDPAPLRGVRYVITLDADTVLPPDTAALLIGALAHPLNRAEYDVELGRVVRGYGILQPRVGVALPSAHRSQFAAVHSGHPGVDPYTTAVSDVYQDLYGEGSFTGKGIYDVDAFERRHARPVSRKHPAVARPDRGELRPCRAGERHRGLRRLPGPLPHLHPPQASLDPGRLAAAPVAHQPGAGSRRTRAQPAVPAVALEDPRQPPAEHGRAGAARVPHRRLDGAAGRAAPLDPARPRRDRGAARRGAAARDRCALRWTSRGAPTTRPWGTTRPPASSSWPWPSPSCRTRHGSRPTRSCAPCGGCA